MNGMGPSACCCAIRSPSTWMIRPLNKAITTAGLAASCSSATRACFGASRGRSRSDHACRLLIDTWLLLIQHLIQIHQLIREHGPSGKRRGIEFLVRLRFADSDQLFRIVDISLVVREQLIERRTDDAHFLGPEWPREQSERESIDPRFGRLGPRLERRLRQM